MGKLEGEDVEEYVDSLFEDPRDTINWAGIWSLSEGQFVFAYRKGGKR